MQEKLPNGYFDYLENVGYKYNNLFKKPNFYLVIAKNKVFGILSETDMLKIYSIVLGNLLADDYIKVSRYKKNGESDFVYSGFTIYSKNLDVLFKADFL